MIPLCSRCLVVMDARTFVRAQFPDRIEECRDRNPIGLRAWAEGVLAEGGRIIVDDTIDRFAPVATWYGDPVCTIHLWECADRERRGARA